MSNIRFEWDPRKSAENQRKHGVSFEEAQPVFFDDRAILLDDPDRNATTDSFCWVSARIFALLSFATAIAQTTRPFGSFRLEGHIAKSAATMRGDGGNETEL